MRYTEDKLQMAVARFLDYEGVLWNHTANERRTSAMHGNKLKKMGVKAGFPDVAIYEPRGEYHGLFIELKTTTSNGLKQNGTPKAPRKGQASPAQKQWIENLNKKGYKAVIAHDWEGFYAAYTAYFKAD